MGLNCGGKCVLVFLLVLNMLFLLLGLGLMITGILMITNVIGLDSDDVAELLNNVQLKNGLGLGIVIHHLPKIVTGVGAVIFVLALLGCLGALFKNKIALIVFAILVLLIFIAQIVCIVLFVDLKDTVVKETKTTLTTQFNKYTGPTGTDKNTKNWNKFFYDFECCGVEPVTKTKNGFEKTKWAATGTDKIPYSCCKSAKENKKKTGTDTSCTETLTAGSYHSKGCYQKTEEVVVTYQVCVVAISATLLVVELVVVIFSFILCKSIGDKCELI